MFHPSHHSESRLLRVWLLVLLAGLILVLWLPAPDAARGLAGYVPLHTTLEVLAMAVAAMVFGTSWATQRYRVDGRAVVLGVAFLGVGLLDLAHTLSYEGMPDFVTPSGSEKAINFWLAARALAAASMLLVAFWPRPWGRWLDRLSRHAALAGVLALVLLVHWLVLFHPQLLPRTFVPGSGLTPFKLAFEYGLIAAYGLAGLGYLHHLRQARAFGAAPLAAAAFTMAMSEFFFTRYANVTDIYNLLGHVYKVLAYGFLYRALFVESVQSPFQALQAAQARQQATLDTLPDLLFEIDDNGVYQSVHATETDKLAAPAVELVGRNIREVLPADAVAQCHAAMAEARRDGVSRGKRLQLVVPDGVRHFELSVARASDGVGGGGAHFLVLSRDVTQAVRQEQQLRFEAELNAALLDLETYTEGDDESDVLRRGARQAKRLTGSGLAFVYLVHENQQDTELAAWVRRSGTNGPQLRLGEPEPPPPLVLDRSAGWLGALHLREPVVGPGQPKGAHHAQAGDGTPRGVGFASVPVVDGGLVRLLLVVSDGPAAYDASAVQALRMLAATLWNLVKRRRQDAVIHQLSEALDQSPYPVVITDADVCIQYANRAFGEVSGYAPAEVLGHNPRLLQSGQTPSSTYADMWRHLSQDQPWQGEFINQRKDGQVYVERAVVYPIRDGSGRLSHYVAHKEDVTLRKSAEERLRQLSEFDALTGLLNKKAFDERLRQAVAQADQHQGQVALLWFDLDNFKSVNDSLGHNAGDELLLAYSQRLRALFGPPFALGRYSGDTFVAIVPDTEQSAVALLAQEALSRLQSPVTTQGSALALSASAGIAMYPGDAPGASLLAAAAETAMYRVKEEGRNGFRFFAPDMQAHTQRSLALAAELRQAASRGELHLVFQPQCALGSRHMVGAEALLRWQHPTWGAVSPGEFIPLAEQTGVIVDIGLWVVEQVVLKLRDWLDAGLPVGCVAINVSAIQFAQPDLVERLLGVLQQHGVSTDHVEIELTEAVALRDPAGAGIKIQHLKDAGFRVSIDDFGTGYSSMSYLKRYALDKLKIDQSFIRDLAHDAGDQAIVTAIVKMAHSLGLSTIAEGVETAEQQAFLEAVGCDEIQGYWYSRPIEATAFEAFVRAQA
ncbi:EAL domain-containing protein [Hydrogenophaga atypica]|uniref:EAL domain-containing protein n=1 Tax=Hydrogenophaga atypica TaxID=249409 RepID=A0ABW2QPI3_9BURK